MRKRKVTMSLAALMMFAVCDLAVAQDRGGRPHLADSSVTQQAPGSTTPKFNFTLGSGKDYFKVVVSNHGNIIDLTSPFGQRHIFGLEGYAVGIGGGGFITFYWDGGAMEPTGCSEMSRSWGAPTFTPPATIERTSCDGVLTLTQTFAASGPSKELTITMKLKNNSSEAIFNVSLIRAFDGNINKDAGDDRYDLTPDSVWGRDVHGLMLNAINGRVPHSADVARMNSGFNPFTDITGTEPTPTPPGNFAGQVVYKLGTINAGASRTVTFLYKRF